MAENGIRVVAHITAKPDKIDATRDALIALIEPTRREEGCIAYELLQSSADPAEFTFVEEWTGHEALNAHFDTDHLRQILSRAEELLAAPPDIRRYTLIA